MIRNLVVGLCLAMCASAALASQPVAKVHLPCESRYQDLSPSGRQVLVHCKDHSLRLVAIPEGTQREILLEGRRANANAYSPDGQWLALGFEDGTVTVISSADPTKLKQWKASPRRIDLLYFLPKGKALVVAPVDSPGQVWDLSDKPTQRASLPADFGGIAACAGSPDGTLLVTAGGDTVVRWYDTATWHKARENREFLLDTFALQFTPDGKQVLAGGADARISFLDAASAKQVRQLPREAGSYIASIDLLLSGQRAVAVYEDNAGEKPPHALIWDLVAGTSAPVKSDAKPTCGGVVEGKLWLCSVEGTTLTISQLD